MTKDVAKALDSRGREFTGCSCGECFECGFLDGLSYQDSELTSLREFVEIQRELYNDEYIRWATEVESLHDTIRRLRDVVETVGKSLADRIVIID